MQRSAGIAFKKPYRDPLKWLTNCGKKARNGAFKPKTGNPISKQINCTLCIKTPNYEIFNREHLANHLIDFKLYKESMKWNLKAKPANYAPTARWRSPYTSLLCFSFCLCFASIRIFARNGSTIKSSSSGALTEASRVWWW